MFRGTLNPKKRRQAPGGSRPRRGWVKEDGRQCWPRRANLAVLSAAEHWESPCGRSTKLPRVGPKKKQDMLLTLDRRTNRKP